jgi:hypothetical protein
MSLFARRSHTNREPTARVKEWVRELLTADIEVTVLVTELQCMEPGCPPLETVIAILRDGAPPQQYTLHRAVADVTRDDVAELAVGERQERS